jgi:hypothetical protein
MKNNKIVEKSEFPKKEKKYWFRSKKYGFGLEPASREGWLITAIYLILIIFSVYRAYISQNPTIWWFVFGFLTLLYIYICFKTGEKLRWRWGN